MTVAPVSAAQINWTRNKRLKEAWPKAATPRNVNGCQANSRFPSGVFSLTLSGRRRRRRLGGLRLILGRGKDNGHRIAQLHDIIHEDFHVIGASRFELDLPKHGDVGGVEGGILQCEFDLALAQHGCLIRGNQAHAFSELADTCSPAIEQAELERDDGKLRHANEIDHANEEKVASDLLADFLA